MWALIQRISKLSSIFQQANIDIGETNKYASYVSYIVCVNFILCISIYMLGAPLTRHLIIMLKGLYKYASCLKILKKYCLIFPKIKLDSHVDIHDKLKAMRHLEEC